MKKPIQESKNQHKLPAYQCDSISEMLQMFYSYSTHATASSITVVQKPLDVRTPFPKFFSKFVHRDGNIGKKIQTDNQG